MAGVTQEGNNPIFWLHFRPIKYESILSIQIPERNKEKVLSDLQIFGFERHKVAIKTSWKEYLRRTLWLLLTLAVEGFWGLTITVEMDIG